MVDGHQGHEAPRGRALIGLCVASLGVVYGDIGTSPLYAIRECFHGEWGAEPTPANILGVLSLLVWSLIFVISVKYALYVLRADNRGEGGILALMALAASKESRTGRAGAAIIFMGLLGASLLYGEGVITPAISVLSAVEGLELAAPSLEPYVVPITIAILIGIFMIQRRGTAGVGKVFGPITLLWFTSIGLLGLPAIARRPDILQAFNPWHALWFVTHHGAAGFFVLGSVVLVITGAEALYADMGHFGRRPIRLMWFVVVMPSLVLNYLGQGALLLERPEAVESPFYLLAPSWALYPLIALATAATIIASQALISGAFSITRQAVMLGFWPRTQVRHTSSEQIGQIYVPTINWLLMAATVALVLEFKTSSGLAAAYGIAVTSTMLLTTALAYIVARRVWGWSPWLAVPVTCAFFAVDIPFWLANLIKLGAGGWVPLAIAVVLLTLMLTWKRGRELLGARIRANTPLLEDFYELMHIERPARVAGTAVFMTGNAEGTPPALMRNFLHNRVVHETNVLLTVIIEEVPKVPASERVSMHPLEKGFFRVVARYGFMEEPNIPALIETCQVPGVDTQYTTYFFGRETLLADNHIGMAVWRKRLFSLMAHASQRATAFFHIKPEQVIELGSQVEL